MDQSREKLQQRISQEIKDRPLQELLRDLTDSAWKWRQGDQAVVTTDRWITVGGQTVRGTTAQEKAAINAEIMPKMLVAGMVTVSITSVLVAGVMSAWL